MEQMTQEEKLLYEGVYVPAFLEKCAERGINISDQESLEAALETTALVKQHLQKAAGNTIKQANANLKQQLGIAQAPAQELAKSAAFQLAQNPNVRAAVLATVMKQSA